MKNRALAAKGISLNDVSVLDRLAYVGSRGMGVLMYKPATLTSHFLLSVQSIVAFLRIVSVKTKVWIWVINETSLIY